MLTENRIVNHLRHLRSIEKLFIQGLILAIVLVIIQSQLDSSRLSLTMYMPPIGFAFLVVITYFVQPILLGVLNIFIINTLYKTKGWQVGIWLNGIFLFLTFSTVNLVSANSPKRVLHEHCHYRYSSVSVAVRVHLTL